MFVEKIWMEGYAKFIQNEEHPNKTISISNLFEYGMTLEVFILIFFYKM